MTISIPDKFAMPSDKHRVVKGPGSLKLMPVGSDLKHLEDFQSIAEAASAWAASEGLDILGHKSSQHPGNLIDSLVIYLDA